MQEILTGRTDFREKWLFYSSIILAVTLLHNVFVRIQIENGSLISHESLFNKKEMDIASIKEVEAGYSIFNLRKRKYSFFKVTGQTDKGENQTFKFYRYRYGEPALKDLFNDLSEANPEIKFDEGTNSICENAPETYQQRVLGQLKWVPLVVFFFAIVFFGINVYHRLPKALSDQEREELVSGIVQFAEDNLPMMVEDGVRLDRVEREDTILSYHFTNTENTKEEIDFEGTAELRKEIMVNERCWSEINSSLLANGITMEFFSYDKNGEFVGHLTVDREDCGY